MTETSEQIKKAPLVDDSVLCGDCANLDLPEEHRFFCRPTICDRVAARREAAEAQRDADAVFYEAVIQRLVAQTRKVLQPIDKARREAVYDVEAFLEDEGLALYYTHYKGDEQLPGEQVGLDIIRRVLEDG